MSSKQTGLLKLSAEWAKHLRPYGKRQFWSQHRMAVAKFLRAIND